MKEYILLLNGRRRVYIVQKIKEYLKELNLNIGIALTDTDNLDPVGYYADKFNILPEVESKYFNKEFLEYVKKENIRYIFLWNNKDFIYINNIKKELTDMGIKILIPEKEKFEICFNKIKTNDFCIKNEISTPKTFLNINEFKKHFNKFPVIIKPFDGKGNMNVFLAENIKELEVFFKKVKNPIIQEYIEGEQYTIDTYYDECTRLVIPRKRVKVRDAEVVEAEIVMYDYLINFGEKVTNSFGVYGPMNIQVIVKDNKPYLIDLHCRFGGGTDLSIEAGAPIHKWIVNYFLGINNDYNVKINDKIFMTRYLKSDFIEI